MRIKKWAWYLLLAFLAFFLISAPAEAAKIVKSAGENAGEWFLTAAHSFNKFLKSLV